MSVEHAAPNKRGLYGAIVNTGVAWGLLLANLMFLALAQLPDGAFRSWGWRVPFLLSAVLVALGLFIRMKVDESPDFAEVKRSGEVAKAPLVQVLRHHSGLVALMCLAYVATGAVFYIGTVFSLGYGTDHLGVDKSAMLGAVMAAMALTLVAIPLFGRWSDRSERFRKGLFLAGVAGMVVLPFPWFALLLRVGGALPEAHPPTRMTARPVTGMPAGISAATPSARSASVTPSSTGRRVPWPGRRG